MKFYLIVVFTVVLFASTLSFAVDYYSTDAVYDCQFWCYPNNNMERNMSCIEWLNSDEWSYLCGRPGDGLYLECGSVDLCKAQCWGNYRDRWYTNHSPWPTEEEMLQAIEVYKIAAEDWEDLETEICNYPVDKWATMAFYWHNIAQHYESGLNDSVKAAEAYGQAADYNVDGYENGFERNDRAGNSEALTKAGTFYIGSAKSYCKAGMDDEAHDQFNKARAAYIQSGNYAADSPLIIGIDGEECGKYAREPPIEVCPSSLTLIGVLLFGAFISRK